MSEPLFRDPEMPVADRVRDLLSRMTLTEKVGQVNQRMYGWDAYERTGSGHRLTDAFRAEVARFDGMGALYGLQRADPWSGVTAETGIGAGDGARVSDAVQRHVVENTRLGIPVLLVEEMPHGLQALDGTLLPVNLAVGATWNPELYEEAAGLAAAELRARGGHVALVSALDLVRDPRWGRAEECFGEDPYLAARFTEALVRGVQGPAGAAIGPDRAAVVLKHFAGQGATVGGRNSAATELGARELHEIHLVAARAGVRAGAAGLMAAYNEFDGVPCAASHHLLTGILRERWGFEGLVMADGLAVDRLVRMAGDPVAAGALALRAGTDLSLWDDCYPGLGEAVRRGLVEESVLDRAVGRVLALKFRLGLFERPYTVERAPDPGRLERLSERMARECVTLLEHDGVTLPLADLPAGTVAVIGPNADSVPQQIGDYTAPQRPGTGGGVLAGVRASAPEGTEVGYARGCGLVGGDLSGLPEAVALAAGADVAVLVLGGSSAREQDTRFDANGAAVVSTGNPVEMTCGEGVDLAELGLPQGQSALLDAVAATGTPVVVVLVQGRPHALPDLTGKAAAVLSAWYPGPWGGRAVADVLFGAAGPQGRLPVSVPRSAAQLPVFYNGKDHGYRGYVDQPATARHPFGHGLSYTTVEYGEPRLSGAAAAADAFAQDDGPAPVVCEVRVSNTGARPVRETVQLYVRRVLGGTTWPRTRELRGFARVELAPGESTDVTFPVDARTLASFTYAGEWAVEPGEFAIGTGPSSHLTQEARLTVTAGGRATLPGDLTSPGSR
ncbi:MULTISPECIES: glycoside hydrolase family 3 N-terminal domain-containing protein [Streptomyces]|uniref:Glycoside hydrolase family 3 N-terminal domain-containing protein n=1 Tax=Streptomyces glycanivorans TaxID=3033808 RepID=A0ABY9JII4_9ACTN|nr:MULTISPECIES: glycoside hydrolase family 3 N-terminal domain-containing protein [unclassified Streptomyces]WSQ79762.1 glycoside hydrolase family 3 C-terminal domain-containing protein [Streptomyces sp. NBC_01213]WLQ66314.1 glycoside hydrolase family 3 N-terminal domain-containing protein [Streptomyces sp. Alt3]WSQ87142.1 glycoside hydrolase family 3 C-terminal domain-containing protein [Streptomyces sp. NBC_01212]WSR06842.1 glycoside hydrolase family 3 C-terminal domain-containing protein [S